MLKYGIMVNFANNIPNALLPRPKSIHFSTNLCPDQIVGDITKIGNRSFLLQNSIILHRQPINNGTAPKYCVDYSNIRPDNYIIFILESPHIAEYDNNGNPTGPACGSNSGDAGYDIEHHLNNVLQNSSSFVGQLKMKTYKLVLLNAVQYQASAGTHPLDKKQKEKNWINFWNKGFDKDLTARLNAFVQKTHECHIVNLCTIGNRGLHFMVNQELKKLAIVFFEGYHPSVNWLSNYKRMIY